MDLFVSFDYLDLNIMQIKFRTILYLLFIVAPIFFIFIFLFDFDQNSAKINLTSAQTAFKLVSAFLTFCILDSLQSFRRLRRCANKLDIHENRAKHFSHSNLLIPV